MYDPSTGRFINEDPIRDGLNWYIYCGNNPVMFVDPWGLKGAPTGEEVYLRDMFNMYKKEKNDQIYVFDNRVVVSLNNRAEEYYYNTEEHGSVHGNRMYGDRMVVNAVEFGQYFRLTKSVGSSGSQAYVFSYLEAGGIPLLGTTTVTWSFYVGYVETPEKKIVFNQGFYASTMGWTLPEYEYSKPKLKVSNEVEFTQGNVTKHVNMSRYNNYIVPKGTYNINNYISDEHIIFDRNRDVVLNSNFVLSQMSALAPVYVKNFRFKF